MDKKLCVLFPGIGYHCDKPLLYYCGKLADRSGYETIKLKYSGFTGQEDAAGHALKLSEGLLSCVDFQSFSRVVFVGKSIGTAAALAYREKYNIAADCVLLTPLALTFEHSAKGSIAFHGTADPWAKTPDIERLCKEQGVKLFEYPQTNHSLETGDPQKDIPTIGRVLSEIENGMIFR